MKWSSLLIVRVNRFLFKAEKEHFKHDCWIEWTCYFVVSFLNVLVIFTDMAYYDGSDEEFESMFITQTPNKDYEVSLEDDDVFKSVMDPQYSDISDPEEEHMERRLR